MDLRFVIALTEHRLFDWVFAPYLVKGYGRKEKLEIYDRITLLNLDLYENAITPEQVQLVRIIEQYNDKELHRVFSKKKKVTARDFMNSITQELFEEQIRPYIEKRLIRCLDILQFNPVPVFYKNLQNIIYTDDRIEVVEDDSSAVFNFHRSSEGLRYFLSIEHQGESLHLKDREAITITNEPCCIFMEDKLFLFRDIDSKKLLPFFEKEYVSIPQTAEKKYFESFVRNAIKHYKVNAEGFSIIDQEAAPRPILSIENDLSGRYFYVLKFAYDEKSVYYANRKTELKVSCNFNNDQVEFIRLKRNTDLENNCISTLLSYGLVNKDGPFFMPMFKKNQQEDSGHEIINWINLNNALLKKAGFSVAQNKLEKDFYLDDFEIKMEVSEKSNDWFDIEAHVEFSGFKIPFASFTKNILNNEREYMLPDGRIVILPQEWFESYRDMLNFSKVDKDKIRLDKQHFSLLNKNVRGISKSFRDNMLSLIDTQVAAEEQPRAINAELRNYQLEGYSWMYRLYKNGFGSCLADDMGLGKTLQTLTVLQRIIDESEPAESQKDVSEAASAQLSLFDSATPSNVSSTQASLIIVPTSLVHNWLNEAKRFAPNLKVVAHVGLQRKPLKEIFSEADLILTSYGIMRNEIDEFVKYEFLNVVLDESQMIKNPGSKTYQAVMKLNAEHSMVLTGTPIENSLTDMWAQINFINPGLLGNLNFFRSEFQYPIEKMQDENKQDKLRKLISPFILRRTKSQVAPELPPVSEQILFCDMEDVQEAYYEREKSKARNLVIEKTQQMGFRQAAMVILQSLTKLRQIANHPSLIDEDYFAGSGKYNEIKRKLQNLHQEQHKVLIFSSFVKHLDLIAHFLDEEGLNYSLLTGETRNREEAIRKFQEEDDCTCFLISLKAGGVGLNLTAADYVFILDPWWNPAAEMQAISRAHRIGQDKHVFVYRFISRNSLEEKILKLQQKKSNLADAFVNNSLKGISQEQVMELFE